MGTHKVVIAQDKGNLLSRIYYYINPLKFNHISVTVKNLYTQAIWGYDAYHEEFEEGKYVLLFSGEDGSRKGTMELEITPDSPSVICVVYKWSEFSMYLSKKQVTGEEFETMVQQKRLMNPKGYQGY